MAPQSRCMASTGNLACRVARSGAVFHIQSRRVFPLPSSPVLRFYFPGHPNAAARRVSVSSSSIDIHLECRDRTIL